MGEGFDRIRCRSGSFVDGIVMATSGVRSRKQGQYQMIAGPMGLGIIWCQVLLHSLSAHSRVACFRIYKRALVMGLITSQSPSRVACSVSQSFLLDGAEM